MTDPRQDELRHANLTLLKKLGVIVVAMFGFGYALVPFYDKICEAAGLRNIAVADEAIKHAGRRDTRRAHRIRLQRARTRLDVRALEPVVSVHPGEIRQVEFEVVNATGRAVTGQAIPSYGPASAEQYFKKMECFCFAQQTLAAGETRRMPVVFVVDPRAPSDLATITLSYTFFAVEGGGFTDAKTGRPRLPGSTRSF
jgi:cytochrome c oxidase assembly protein subunit 11